MIDSGGPQTYHELARRFLSRLVPQVWRACPSSWLSVVIDGTGRPGTRSPLKICFRMRAASRTYDRGSASPRSTGRFMDYLLVGGLPL